MTVVIPHFDLPFRFGTAGGNAAVAQQDSQDDVRNCVEAVIRTTVGTRLYVPNFGITDPVFLVQPIDTTLIKQQIDANEPRARLVLSDAVETLDQMISDITVEVSNT